MLPANSITPIPSAGSDSDFNARRHHMLRFLERWLVMVGRSTLADAADSVVRRVTAGRLNSAVRSSPEDDTDWSLGVFTKRPPGVSAADAVATAGAALSTGGATVATGGAMRRSSREGAISRSCSARPTCARPIWE